MAGFFSTSTLIGKTLTVSKLSRCGSCGLARTCLSPKMQPTGEGRKKILIVAEAPGKNEDEKGIQLIGKSGKLLRQLLKELGIDLDRDCWKTNAIICRPPKNAPPTNEQIAACAPNLFATIERLNPVAIILLGGVSVQALIGTLREENLTSRTLWMGQQIPLQRLNAWVCPTYHPAYLLRMEDSLIERITKEHLRQAIEKARRRPWKEIPNYEDQIEIIASNPVKVIVRMRQFIEQGGSIAFDYEANCLKPEYMGSQLYSCAICWNGKRTIAFPWSDSILPTFVDLMKSPLKKIAANAKFEDRWTRNKLRIGIRNWNWDTMLAAHVLDNRPGVTGLKFQAFAKMGLEDYNKHIEPLLSANGINHINRIHEIEMKDLLLYNGMDALLEFKLARIQMKQLGLIE